MHFLCHPSKCFCPTHMAVRHPNYDTELMNIERYIHTVYENVTETTFSQDKKTKMFMKVWIFLHITHSSV